MDAAAPKKVHRIRKSGLASKLSGLVALTALCVYLPVIVIGVFDSVRSAKKSLAEYKQALEVRIQSSFEPAIWNYDVDTLRKLMSIELINKNLKSLRISSGENTLIWLSSENDQIVEGPVGLKGGYIDRRVTPITRFDERDEIIAYATIWYDHAQSRNELLQSILATVLKSGIVIILIAIAVNYSTYVKLVKPLESIRESMIEAGKSSLSLAHKRMEKVSFKSSFKEIRSMASDLEHMLLEIESAYNMVKASENFFKAIFFQAGVGVAQISLEDGKYLIVNQRFCDIVGYTSEELIGSTCDSITYPEDIPVQHTKIEELLSENKHSLSFEKRFVCKDQRIVWAEVTVSPLWSKEEEPTTQIMVIQDITSRKKAEQEIIKLNDELEAKVAARTNELEEANCELEATIEDLKTAQSQLISHEKMAVLGQLVSGIAHELNTPLGVITSADGTLEKVVQSEIQEIIDFCSGASEEALSLYQRLVDIGKSVLGYQDLAAKRLIKKMYYDVLGKNRLDISDSVVERLVEIGYNQSTHDFMNLINTSGSAEAIRSAYSITIINRSAQMIRISAEKASKVISALKTYSHNDSSQSLSQYDVIKDIEVVLTLYYNQIKYGIDIVKDYRDVPPVMCFPDKLHQVWVNIINNALQAMDYKGRLNISVSQIKDKVRVSITDNGPGIPESISDKIFEPFFTTKKSGEGTGLGLDIAKRIVEEIGGSISFQSKPGETTFHIILNT